MLFNVYTVYEFFFSFFFNVTFSMKPIFGRIFFFFFFGGGGGWIL